MKTVLRPENFDERSAVVVKMEKKCAVFKFILRLYYVPGRFSLRLTRLCQVLTASNTFPLISYHVHYAQTPLIRFVVDLLYNLLYNKSTTNPRQIYDKSKCCTTNPRQIDRLQQIHNISTCRDVVDLLYNNSESTTKLERFVASFLSE